MIYPCILSIQYTHPNYCLYIAKGSNSSRKAVKLAILVAETVAMELVVMVNGDINAEMGVECREIVELMKTSF